MFKLLIVFIGCIILTPGTIEAKSVLSSAKKVVNKIAAKQIVQKKCPVMGGAINPNLYYQYSKKIYVCCPGCISTIKKNPVKYLKIVQKEIAASKVKTQKKCPVMGGKINSSLYYTYNKKIYVCCPGCIAKIKKNPEKYLKIVQKNLKNAKKK